MAIDPKAAGIALILLAGAFAAHGQTFTPAPTLRPSEAEGLPAYEVAKRERDRVRLLKGYVCADAATTRIQPAEIEQILGRFPEPATPGYVPASRIHTGPMASFPTDQLDAGNPGSVLVMLTIREDGEVAEARAACATGDTFAERARETALRNRYRAARLDDVPVASTVFQMVTYGIELD